VKPAPLTVAALTITAEVPVEVKVTDWVAGVLRFTLPKGTLVALMLSVATAGPSCSAKVSATLPALAVKVAVCAVVHEDTVALKVALVAPAGTVTEAGTVTAELLLARLTANPPLAAAAVRETVQLSVPAAVIELLLQLSALNDAVGDADV
jgi:hypothetical protein